MKILKKYWFHLSVALIFILALVLRLPSFGSLPRGLNRDEAALGYNAFSLLKTGHDEHGVRLPITFASFGDQKLGGYIYALIPFIALFDLDIWVVKLPSLLSGLIIIGLIGAITSELTKSFWKPDKQKVATLIAMTFVAISPWAHHFSRVAYEAHVAMMCFLYGWLALQKALNGKHQRFWLSSFGLALGYSLITYHSYQVITPLFVLGSLIIVQKKLPQLDRIGLILGTSFGVLAVILLLSNQVLTSNLTKHAGISPYSKESLARQFSLMRLALPTPHTLNKFLSNQVTEGIFIFAKNVSSVISPSFLFVSGTGQDVHNPGEMANLHLFSFPFIIIGLHFLAKQKQNSSKQLFFLWLGLSLVPSALTISPNHTIRANALFPALEVLAALGFSSFLFRLKKPWKFSFALLSLGLLTISALRMHADYFVLAPKRDEAKSHERYHLLAKKLILESQNNDLVYTQQPSSSPYIWYLFESAYDPSLLQKNITYYEEDAEHFKHVAQIGNVHFKTVTWNELREASKNKKVSVIFRPEEIPSEMREGGEMIHQETLHDYYGKAVYEIWHMKSSL